MTQLLIAVLSAVAGAGAAYVFDLRAAHRRDRQERARVADERRAARAALATALLFDLKRIEFDLRQVYEADHPARSGTEQPDLYFSDMRAKIRWFAPTTLSEVSEAFRRAEHFYSTLAMGRSHKMFDEEGDYHMRCLAAFAIQMIPVAAEALVSEGGVTPPPNLDRLVRYPEVPAIPERYFEDSEVLPEEADRGAV